MLLEHFLLTEVNEANVYVVACEKSRQACLVDAGGFDQRVVDFAREHDLEMRSILITHDHYDHTGGLAEFVDAFPRAEVLAGTDSAGGLGARALADGDHLRFGSLDLNVLAIPGHTPDSLAFHFACHDADTGRPTGLVLFSGDALFAGSVGGASGANHDQEIQGIRSKFFALPPETAVYPGHGPATTIGVEMQHNPFF